MDICGITQWVLSRLKGSIYPVYTVYIPKPILISDFQFWLLAACWPVAPKTTELKQSHLLLQLWACHHAWQQQQQPAVLPPPRGAKPQQQQQEGRAAISLDVHQLLHGRDSSNDFVLEHVGRSALFDKDLDKRVAYSCTMVVEGLTCTHCISL